MPKRRSLLAASVYLAVMTAGVAPLSAQQGMLAGLDRYIETALGEWEVPGLALSVVRNDSLIYARGYGVRELGQSARVDESTLFAIGSASKAFTAAAVAMLVDEDAVDWSDRATEHLPEFELFDPYVTREITVRDLLSHRSGLSRGDLLWYSGAYDRDEILHRVRHLEPTWSFRAQFGYQNIMYLAAGQVVARVTGHRWDDVITERIFRPLGMRASNTTVTALRGQPNVATPHARIEDEVVPVAWRNIDAIAPAGSINSNVVDMAQWVRLQLGQGKYGDEQLISSGAVSEMHKPHTIIPNEGVWAALNPGANFLTYGLGWFLMDYNGHKVVQHGGNIDGMSALVAMIPKEQIGLVILTNMNGTLLTSAVMYRVFDHLLDTVDKDWSADMLTAMEGMLKQAEEAQAKAEASRIAGTAPSLPLSEYAGTFADSLYGPVEVAHENGHLVARYGKAFEGDLEHWHYDTFRATWRDRILGKSLVRFTIDEQAKASEVHLEQLGDFDRVPDAADTTATVALSEAQLRDFVGAYTLEAPPIEMSVELVGGALKLTVPGQPTYTLAALTERRFRIAGAPAGFFVEFLAEDGQVTQMKLEQPNVTLTLDRKRTE